MFSSIHSKENTQKRHDIFNLSYFFGFFIQNYRGFNDVVKEVLKVVLLIYK